MPAYMGLTGEIQEESMNCSSEQSGRCSGGTDSPSFSLAISSCTVYDFSLWNIYGKATSCQRMNVLASSLWTIPKIKIAYFWPDMESYLVKKNIENMQAWKPIKVCSGFFRDYGNLCTLSSGIAMMLPVLIRGFLTV